MNEVDAVVSTCDLHTHTYYSDGRASPRELVQHAAAIGLRTLAITDHDTARGAREALTTARELGIELVPAIEFTCRWDELRAPVGQTDIDVLGYCVDLDQPHFQAAERAALEDIQERVVACCKLLTSAGYAVTLEDVLAQNPYYAGLLPLVKALEKNHRVPWSVATALVDTAWHEVRPCSSSIEQVIATIHAAGGVAVLAHPSLVPWGKVSLPTALKQLVDWGLDGLEVYHPRLDLNARQTFLTLAKRFGLIVTGGSDEHGWPTGFPKLGCEVVSGEVVQTLYTRQFNGLATLQLEEDGTA